MLEFNKTVTTEGGTFESGVEELPETSRDTVRYYFEIDNDASAVLFDLDWTDDNGTLSVDNELTLAGATILKVIPLIRLVYR